MFEMKEENEADENPISIIANIVGKYTSEIKIY